MAVKGANVIIGIPSFGMVSTYFLQSRASQQFPLVSSSFDKIVLNKPIADARNEIVEFALSQGANYIFWLDDDVIAPGDAFLKLYRHNKDIINGVYWSKSNPPMPLLFRGHLSGPYWDWHFGDLIEIDAAGNGLTLVKTDVYRKIGEPWYSVNYHSFPGVTEGMPSSNTEDLYFYWKAKKAGYKVWADTTIQAFHYDKNSNMFYGMPANAPQAHPGWEILPQGEKLIADYGSGSGSIYLRDEGKVVSFDIREEVNPTVVCDIRRLPVPDQTFDIVFSSHTLEHFGFNDVQNVLKEWVRTLKVGGELRLVVPNLRHVGYRLVTDTMTHTDMFVMYGEQDYPKNFHAAGFTPNTLRSLVESLKCFENIEIAEADVFGPPNADNWSLQLRAIKVKHPVLDNIAPDDLEPAPTSGSMWAIPIYPETTERPMTQEEVLADMEKAADNKEPPKFNFFGPPEERIWKREEKVEDQNGLDSNKEVGGSTEGGNPRKTSTRRRRGTT
jgi:ubiquinone/menaquinone biosynthesis C-methylase UbiE